MVTIAFSYVLAGLLVVLEVVMTGFWVAIVDSFDKVKISDFA